MESPADKGSVSQQVSCNPTKLASSVCLIFSKFHIYLKFAAFSEIYLYKNVTGEMLVGQAQALFMDEISTGLDSSTTYQIVNSLRQSIHILNGTAVISLLQPAPETYELFDDIIVLSDGQIVYQGSRENVLEFFECMGFKCPERKGVADFLQEVIRN